MDPLSTDDVDAADDIGAVHRVETAPAEPLTDGYAAAGLAAAIAGLVIPIVPSVAALYLGAASTGRIDAEPERFTGAHLNTASRVVAWVGMALWILGSLFVLAGIAGRIISG